MSTRVSLRRTSCDAEGGYADYSEAYRAVRQHSTHSFGCIQFVSATAYLQGSADVA